MFGKTVLYVSGMNCEHCERRIETAVSSVAGVKGVKASAAKGTVSVRCGNDAEVLNKVKNAIIQSGYGVNDGENIN